MILIVLGLNLAGVLRIPRLERTWRPMDAGAAGSIATATGTVSLSAAGAGPDTGARTGREARRPDRELEGWLARVVRARRDLRHRLDAVRRRDPRRRSSASPRRSQTVGQGGILLLAYSLGLGLPFLAIALVYERAPAIMRPLVRHGRAVSVIGGALVVAVGVAMVMDWLFIMSTWFGFAGI